MQSFRQGRARRRYYNNGQLIFGTPRYLLLTLLCPYCNLPVSKEEHSDAQASQKPNVEGNVWIKVVTTANMESAHSNATHQLPPAPAKSHKRQAGSGEEL